MTDKPTPTDAELKAMWQLHAADIGGIFYYARAVLAKWGRPAQAAEPVARTLASHAAGEAGYCLFSRPVPSETPLYAASQPDPAYSEACDLATALFKKHFAHLPDYASGRVVWGLCDSTAGVISQIDNMVSCLVQPPTTSPQTAQPAPATQQAGERVYAFRRKGLADFCTCDEARYEELSNKPHLFETRIFYTAPQPVEREPLTDEQIKDLQDDGVFWGACRQIVRAIEAEHGIKGGQHD